MTKFTDLPYEVMYRSNLDAEFVNWLAENIKGNYKQGIHHGILRKPEEDSSIFDRRYDELYNDPLVSGLRLVDELAVYYRTKIKFELEEDAVAFKLRFT